MNTFYVAETPATDCANEHTHWKETNARTLEAAKRAAGEMQVFEATALHVAMLESNGYRVVSCKRPSGINRNFHGHWVDIEMEDDGRPEY